MALQILMGEGFLREKNPSPIIARGNTEPPSPARGEGNFGTIARVAAKQASHRPGSTVTFGVVGRLVFDTTMDGTSLISTVQLCRARSRKRWSVKVMK